MAEQETSLEKADLQASLDRLGGERRFVVRNVGSASALDVRLTVDSERDKNSPVSASEVEKTFPVQELKPGENESLGAIITPGTGLHFRAVVTWRNTDGSEEERVFYISA